MDENELSKKMLGVTNALFLEELAKGERCYLALRINGEYEIFKGRFEEVLSEEDPSWKFLKEKGLADTIPARAVLDHTSDQQESIERIIAGKEIVDFYYVIFPASSDRREIEKRWRKKRQEDQEKKKLKEITAQLGTLVNYYRDDMRVPGYYYPLTMMEVELLVVGLSMVAFGYRRWQP